MFTQNPPLDKFSKKPRTAQTLTPHTHAPLSLLFAVASPLSLLFAVASPLLPSCLHRSSPPPPPPSLPPLRRRLATPPTFTASLRCTARFSGSRSRAARSGSDCATTLALARGSARPAWNTAHGLQRRKFRRGVVAPRNLARANLSARQPRSREGPWSTSTPGSALPRCPRGPNPGPPRPRRRPLRSASSPLPHTFLLRPDSCWAMVHMMEDAVAEAALEKRVSQRDTWKPFAETSTERLKQMLDRARSATRSVQGEWGEALLCHGPCHDAQPFYG
ncbi:unnamed protein product [Urochloa humidicola]